MVKQYQPAFPWSVRIWIWLWEKTSDTAALNLCCSHFPGPGGESERLHWDKYRGEYNVCAGAAAYEMQVQCILKIVWRHGDLPMLSCYSFHRESEQGGPKYRTEQNSTEKYHKVIQQDKAKTEQNLNTCRTHVQDTAGGVSTIKQKILTDRDNSRLLCDFFQIG